MHPVAIAHTQGIRAGKAISAMPIECPWPIHDHEAVLAWFADFSLGALVKTAGEASALARIPMRTKSDYVV